jgi:hypothetical protein
MGFASLYPSYGSKATARKFYGRRKNLESRHSSISECQMPITKLEAAQHQLDCAIRLLLNSDDLSSVITLSRAAFRILFDIYPVLQPEEDFNAHLDRAITQMGWAKFNKIANQLKHADNDADAVIDPNPIHAMVGIGLAIVLHRQITGRITLEMQAFETIMTVLEPDTFA